jgi:hypothetical protein
MSVCVNTKYTTIFAAFLPMEVAILNINVRLVDVYDGTSVDSILNVLVRHDLQIIDSPI